jgi:ATP-dependent RNA helicase RhlE
VNYDMPNTPEDYVHRIGRTARAGASGRAISLLDAEEMEKLHAIEKLLGIPLACEDVAGFEYHPDRIVPDPDRRVARGGRGGAAAQGGGADSGGAGANSGDGRRRRSGRRGGSGRASRRFRNPAADGTDAGAQ